MARGHEDTGCCTALSREREPQNSERRTSRGGLPGGYLTCLCYLMLGSILLMCIFTRKSPTEYNRFILFQFKFLLSFYNCYNQQTNADALLFTKVCILFRFPHSGSVSVLAPLSVKTDTRQLNADSWGTW